MSVTWHGPPIPPGDRIGPLGWMRVGLRGAPLLAILGICFPLLLVLRGPERALFGVHRPVTPWITQGVCILGCAILGLTRHTRGTVMQGEGAFVANHSSWLDVFVLNACTRLYFVAKGEVQGWPGIGWLARGTGTLFISRDRAQAAAQTRAMEARLRAGHKLLFFPEGTSTDGRRVLAFRSTLFQAFLSDALRDRMQVQPVSVTFTAPHGARDDFYGWWGDMDFGGNLLMILAARRGGRVQVVFHPLLRVADFKDRKALAAAAEAAVRQGFGVPAPAD
jgi:1-acyl-sn-glycerol-3-phosphate acyltransferase